MIAIVIAGGLLVLLEGSIRIVARLRTGAWPTTRAERQTRFAETVGHAYQRHPYLLVLGRSGARLDVAGHRVTFESHGYRGPEVAIHKPPGRFRVLCTGGSTTFDLLAGDDSSTWPARLERLLAADGVDTVNAGFPGWTTVESLASLELRDVDTQPDVVVVFAGINDLQPASHDPFARDYSVGHAEILRRVLGVDPIPLSLASRLLFIEWLHDKFHRPADATKRGYAPAFEWDGGPRRATISAAAVDVYRRNLRSTIAVARANGARVLIAAQHVMLAAGDESDRDYVESWAPGLTAEGFAASLERYNAAARGLAADGLAQFVDPFEAAGFTRDDFGDPMHFGPSGSEKFAEVIAATVRGMRAGTAGP